MYSSADNRRREIDTVRVADPLFYPIDPHMENTSMSIEQCRIDDRQALSTLAAALAPFKDVNKIGSMPLSIVATFILVAQWPGKTVGEYAKLADTSINSMSRQLADLSDTNRHGGAGMGLIQQRVDLQDGRYQRSTLTVKGGALVRTITGAMQPRPMARAA
jgi:DNA-binding MarR family transcriptional regulator